MDNPLIIVSLSTADDEGARLQRLSEWMGVDTTTICIDTTSDPIEQLERQLSVGSCVAMNASTLAALYGTLSHPKQLTRFVEERCAVCLVFDSGKASEHDSALAGLTNGEVNGVSLSKEPASEHDFFHFPLAARALSMQFAGISFSPSRPTPCFVFETSTNASKCTAIMLAGGKPACLSIDLPKHCRIFLIASSAPDIDQPLSREKGIEENHERIIPFLIFIRASFGSQSWHGIQNTARFIIDDPLLADTYGCLNYNNLFGSMQRHKFGTSIAFIPWNYRRTSKRWADGFPEKRANLSICIHGCDHTNREFSSQDADTLAYQASVSLYRMEKHEERTRLPFERVMVFPQGYFSKSAIRALRRNKYLAAVNTSCFPMDGAVGELTIADFLRPAITRFYGFPIFQRHYPRRLIDFAFDLFLGKPAFIVEHHPYLSEGLLKLESFVGDLHRVEPDLTWPTMSSQIEGSCVMRRRGDGSCAVRFFTGKFVLRNNRPTRTHFLLEKEEPGESVIRSVRVDGKSIPFSSRENSIQFEVELDAGQVGQIEVVDETSDSLPIKRLGMRYSFGVFVRRELSEFRDNTLSKHPAVLKRAKKIADRLRVTGDHKRGPNR
jgi:hypothetical protein